MRLKTRVEGDTTILQLEGEVSGKDAVKIQQRLEEVRNQHDGPVTVDLAGVDFIDSHGLGVLIYHWNVLEKAGRKLVFRNPSPFIKEVVTNTNLDKIITIVQDPDGV